MKFFKKFFNNKRPVIPSKPTDSFNKLSTAISAIDSFLGCSIYISKSSYLTLLNSYLELFNELKVIKKNALIDAHCKSNSIKPQQIDDFLLFYNSDELRTKHNEDFVNQELVNRKDYFDNILNDLGSNIKLDEDQLRAVVNDEDNLLIVAGAGAGKTTTVAAKVKYLVDIKKIDPEDILVISFTNKAVEELKERINDRLKISCHISTFHSVGYSILQKQEERKSIKDESFLYNSVRDYLKTKILNDKNMSSKILLFFASYLDIPPDFNMSLNELFSYTSQNDFVTLKSDLNMYLENTDSNRKEKRLTINDERVASHQELQISNFLFINGIDYVYEDQYKHHIKNSTKIYTPDFHIKQGDKEAYLEHFGMISDRGKNNNRSQAEITKYIQAIKDKIALHKAHKTLLLKTFGKYEDGKDIIEHLKVELLNNGFSLEKKPEEEILHKIVSSEQNKYISKLVKFIKNFISSYKTNGYNTSYFKTLKNKTKNERDKIFLDICEGAYHNYQNDLLIANSIDFSDMINNSVEVISEMQKNNEKLKYKYIIVDEYQDISHQRFNLIKELSKICDAKVVAVGDDWQSIYAFSGADLSLFTDFEKSIVDKNRGFELLYINNTYRNAQELIDIAGKFVLKNSSQILKNLKSPKNISEPVVIYSYCDDEEKINRLELRNTRFQQATALQLILDKIVDENPSILNTKGKEPILLIGRYGFDAERLSVGKANPNSITYEVDGDKSYNLFDYHENEKRVVSKKYPTLKMAFLTAHSSKGLTYDNVIIINGMNNTYGFPSKREDDPIMNLVVRNDQSIEYAEERRLFYVALTRTRNRVYIIAPETRPSEFVSELIQDQGYKNISVIGDFNEISTIKNVNYCPDCGFPLKYRKGNSIGLPLYICSNEHELCGFMTNDLNGGRLRVLKCPDCLDGYLISKKRPGSKNFFLGCSNYNKDGSGCKKTMSLQEFEFQYPKEMNGYYHSSQINNRDPLIYVGDTIQNKVILDTSPNKSPDYSNLIKKSESQEYLVTQNLRNFVSTLEDELKVHENCILKRKFKSKIVYIQKDKSWHWFWFDLTKAKFFYRYDYKSEIKNFTITEANMSLIRDKINNLVDIYLVFFTSNKRPKNLKTSTQKSTSDNNVVSNLKQSKSFFSNLNSIENMLMRQFIRMICSDYNFLTYLNYYGLPLFSLDVKGSKSLFWFIFKNGKVFLKYRNSFEKGHKPAMREIDFNNLNETYDFIKELIESHSTIN